VEAVDGRLGPDRHHRVDLLPFEDAFGVDVEVDGDLGVACRAGPEHENERERGGERGQLRPPDRERRDQANGCESGMALDARTSPSRHGVAAIASSAFGVGTLASTSLTTSSAETRWTQSSARP